VPGSERGRRADATLNRQRILAAAREALDEDTTTSMIEIARRAELGSATLYRNFPSREALLEALLFDEIEELCGEAARIDGATAGERLDNWFRRLSCYVSTERPVALDLLAQEVTDSTGLVLRTRSRLADAGGPLLAAARSEGAVRDGVEFSHAVDLVMAVAKIRGGAEYRQEILETALAGLHSQR
jgi:AcrR family transcriptional regulator